MRHGFLMVGALALFSLAAFPLSAQQPAPRTTPADVQVGVPGGGQRGTTPNPGQGVQPGGGGGRRGRGPAGPAPRSVTGRVLLQGRTPSEKGVWLPEGVVTTSFSNAAEIPFQPWAKALYEDRQTHRLEPHARCKPSGAARQVQTPYGVEFVELRDLQRIYIFDIGGPHTWRTIYMDGRTHPSDLAPELLRPLDRLVGGRHAGRRYDGLQRGLLAGSWRHAAHEGAAHARALHANGRGDHPLRADHRRSEHLHQTVGWRASTCAGRPEPSCSNTSARSRTTPAS